MVLLMVVLKKKYNLKFTFPKKSASLRSIFFSIIQSLKKTLLPQGYTGSAIYLHGLLQSPFKKNPETNDISFERTLNSYSGLVYHKRTNGLIQTKFLTKKV